ncbi:sensor histidine kinase [Dyadobacter subterraneus]|uniref:Histidine kinase n=1 Tax=Dyadobacter subterraneus TaxID=2773304 RepID=A0ABR9WEB6_9BACT|nr:histidine kinase [Dyadobacter subterraneus]MBE9463843.1 histidine kinase [Dyadobacter subterraneus]
MPLLEKIIYLNVSHRLLSHVLFWLVVTLIFLNRYDMVEFEALDKVLYRHFFYMAITMISSYFLAYLIIPRLLRPEHYLVVSVIFVAGSYFISVVSRIAVIYFLEPLIRTPPFGQESVREIMTDIPKLITHYFALSFSMAWLFALAKLIKDQYVVQKHSLLLEKQKAQTELHALKAQLNPHFLFNTLNNIYCLSLINSPVTSESIAGLSQILDHVLYRCSQPFVSISSEIALIENYLTLERLRYDERLRVSFTHSIDQDAEIAPLILLSLVENAFKHGLGENMGSPVIDIVLELNTQIFQFKISNDFVDETGKVPGERIGLANIRKQLQLVYGDDHSFLVSSEQNSFMVTLQIDLRQKIQHHEN